MLKSRVGALLLVAVALTAGARPALARAAQDASPDAALDRAMALHRAGDILGAIDAYLAILEKSPDRADVRSNLGAAYARLGRHTEAIEQYRRALAADKPDPAIRFNLGLALYKAARFPEAATELALVVEQQPDNKSALLLLAECQLQQGHTAQVVELLAPHEAALGEDRAYAYLFGSALIRENDLKRGQVYIDRVLRGGDSAEARLLMGAAQLRAGDPKAARDELRRAAELNPSLPGVHSLLGQALQRMADAEGAEQAYRRALEQDPNDFEANLQLGNMRRDVGRYEEAAAYLTRAARLRGDDLMVLHALGSLHLATGQFQKACDALEPLVKRAPEFQQGHALLAMAYARLGRTADAERERETARRLSSERQQKEEAARPAPAPAAPRPETAEGQRRKEDR
jgi:Flp pilus assembly protein TadD